MPPYNNPLNGLQTLFTKPGYSYEPGDDPSVALLQLQQQRESELRDNLANAAPYGGPDVSRFKALLGGVSQDIAENPLTAQKAQVDATNKANQEALSQGFTGGSTANIDYGPSGQVSGVQIGGSPYSPSQQAGRSRQGMEAMKVQAPILAEQEKSRGGLAEQQAKSQGALDLEQKRADILKGMLGMGGTPVPSHEPGAAPGVVTSPPPGQGGPASPSPIPSHLDPKTGKPLMPPLQAPGVPAPKPAESTSWLSWLTGKGAPPYSDLASTLGAQSERLKYSMGMPTPFSDIAQQTSFANLEQVQGMFPGVRGVQHLLDSFREHQAVFGREAPAGSYQRMNGMLSMLDEAEQGMNDPSLRFKTGPNGQLEMASPPQAIQRAKILLSDTRSKLVKAKAKMEELYPGIQGALQQSTDPYSNPNYQPR